MAGIVFWVVKLNYTRIFLIGHLQILSIKISAGTIEVYHLHECMHFIYFRGLLLNEITINQPKKAALSILSFATKDRTAAIIKYEYNEKISIRHFCYLDDGFTYNYCK